MYRTSAGAALFGRVPRRRARSREIEPASGREMRRTAGGAPRPASAPRASSPFPGGPNARATEQQVLPALAFAPPTSDPAARLPRGGNCPEAMQPPHSSADRARQATTARSRSHRREFDARTASSSSTDRRPNCRIFRPASERSRGEESSSAERASGKSAPAPGRRRIFGERDRRERYEIQRSRGGGWYTWDGDAYVIFRRGTCQAETEICAPTRIEASCPRDPRLSELLAVTRSLGRDNFVPAEEAIARHSVRGV